MEGWVWLICLCCYLQRQNTPRVRGAQVLEGEQVFSWVGQWFLVLEESWASLQDSDHWVCRTEKGEWEEGFGVVQNILGLRLCWLVIEGHLLLLL